jgi:hypothetical protein
LWSGGSAEFRVEGYAFPRNSIIAMLRLSIAEAEPPVLELIAGKAEPFRTEGGKPQSSIEP